MVPALTETASGGVKFRPSRAFKIYMVLGALAVVLCLAIGLIVDRENAAIEHARIAQEKAQRVAQERHDRAARENHLRREAWQKAHPAEYALQRARAREVALQQAATRAKERARQRVIDEQAERERAVAQARQAKEEHPCDTAIDALNSLSNNDSRQTQFDKAASGLHYAELCDNVLIKTVTMGKLLGWKAVAEHGLSSGDSVLDINQAITLLARCQTLPGAYGEKTGASCEAEEETLIRYKMKWDMDRY